MRFGSLLLALAGLSAAAGQTAVRAAIHQAKARKPAPEFALTDSSGKTVKLKDYRGKVVLLDFWATWCTGCKKEIPWFAEFERVYGAQGLAVVGVSMDEGGWKVVKPFLAETARDLPDVARGRCDGEAVRNREPARHISHRPPRKVSGSVPRGSGGQRRCRGEYQGNAVQTLGGILTLWPRHCA